MTDDEPTVGLDDIAHKSVVPPVDESDRPNYVPNQLIVRFRKGIAVERVQELIEAQNATILSAIDPVGGEYVIGLAAGVEPTEAAARFSDIAEVEYAEPDILYYVSGMPNDALYASHQGQPDDLQRGYFNGVGNDRNLNAEAAWDITTGDSSVVIAIIDTGISRTHPDLAANTWVNTREIPGNGIDDDHNGFVDDIYGWDFYFDDNDPSPDLGDGQGDGNVWHGTFVAGCAAAASNNGEGVAGACWHAQLMALKVFTDDGGSPASAIASAIRYAADNGANVINMSFGSSTPSSAISKAAAYAWSKGLLMVAAAGNGNSNRRQFPARLPKVISVGGSASANSGIQARASFTQFGPQAVDVVAPAMDLVSTAVISAADAAAGYGETGEPAYFYGDGTSFASPLVAGEAALLLGRAHDLGLDGALANADFRQIILTATTDLPDDPTDAPDGGAQWDGHGRVDFLAAVQRVITVSVAVPNPPTKVVAKPANAGQVQLTWQDKSNNEQVFKIQRALKTSSGVGPFETIANVSPNATAYSDVTVQSKVSYQYRVCAANLAGDSSPVASATLTTP